MKYLNFSSYTIAFLFVFSCLIYVGCQKEEQKNDINDFSELESRNSTPENGCNLNISNARIEFGKLLYNAMVEDIVLSNYIKSKMIEEFNTNYSFLYIKERNQIVHSGKTFEQLLIQSSNMPSLQVQTQIDDIICKDPLLTISMSDGDNVNVTNWTNTIPQIAAVKECIETKYILYGANSPNGIEMTNDPVAPTLNIISSEVYYLVKPDGTTSKTKKIDEYMPSGPSITSILNCTVFNSSVSNSTVNTFNICGNSYKLFYHDEILQMYIDCFNLNTPPYVNGDGPGGGGGGPTGNPCTKPCARDCETLDETLVRYRIKNWQVFKAIANRFWERYFIFHGKIIGAINYSNGAASTHPGIYVSGALKKGDILNCSGVCTGIWQTPNYRIWQDWDESNFGSPYSISWSEEDNGTQTIGLSVPYSTNFKVKIGGLEVSTTYGFTANISTTAGTTVSLGVQAVFYCDPIMKVNDTSSLQFQCN
jgi:hypothetical protein